LTLTNGHWLEYLGNQPTNIHIEVSKFSLLKTMPEYVPGTNQYRSSTCMDVVLTQALLRNN